MNGADSYSELRARLMERLAGTAPGSPEGGARLAGLPPEISANFRHLLPENPRAAAVLVPIVDRQDELTILLTQRAPDLKHHGGQISFPGGRLEPEDSSALAAALRETYEEIGLEPRFIEVLGYLPDHLIISGFQVTPVVAFITPGFELKLDRSEVADTFEVPLAHILDAANHKARSRQLGGREIEVYDIPFGERNIWGATAGILMNLFRLLRS